MENRFTSMFARLKERSEGAFMPFVTLCDPNYEMSYRILQALVQGGADALELGFPFSDPCADGPVIQKADKRALGSGATTDDYFRIIAQFRKENPDLPISVLLYSNVVVARGVDRFFADAAAAGIDGVLIADIPVGMLHTCGDFAACAERHGVGTVLIAPPNADDATIEAISKVGKGYTYMLSRFGTTGTDKAVGHPTRVISRLKELGAAPSMLGFGISTPDQVRDAMKMGAAGAIAGSGVVGLVGQFLDDPDKMLREIRSYIRAMKTGTIA